MAGSEKDGKTTKAKTKNGVTECGQKATVCE